jgi:hypothetical protein
MPISQILLVLAVPENVGQLRADCRLHPQVGIIEPPVSSAMPIRT